jgi:antirestriction protein
MSKYRVYVGTYAAYNSGSLKGQWFDPQDYSDHETFIETCQEFHGPGEHEFMFQDHENIPRCFITESHIDPELWTFMDAADRYDEGAAAAYVEYYGDWNEEEFCERYAGEWSNDVAFAENLAEESGMFEAVPAHLRYYIDMEAWARDLMLCDYTEVDGFYFRR